MSKRVVRIIVSPVIGIGTLGIILAGCIPIFPLTFLALFYCGFLIITYPFVKFLNHIGSEIDISYYLSCPVSITKSIWINIIIFSLFPIWLPFVVMADYIKTGKFVL